MFCSLDNTSEAAALCAALYCQLEAWQRQQSTDGCCENKTEAIGWYVADQHEDSRLGALTAVLCDKQSQCPLPVIAARRQALDAYSR